MQMSFAESLASKVQLPPLAEQHTDRGLVLSIDSTSTAKAKKSHCLTVHIKMAGIIGTMFIGIGMGGGDGASIAVNTLKTQVWFVIIEWLFRKAITLKR